MGQMQRNKRRMKEIRGAARYKVLIADGNAASEAIARVSETLKRLARQMPDAVRQAVKVLS